MKKEKVKAQPKRTENIFVKIGRILDIIVPDSLMNFIKKHPFLPLIIVLTLYLLNTLADII